MATGPMAIDFDKIVKRYTGPAGDVEALRGISFTVGTGQIFGLLGPNGAGKTTSIETLAGLRKQTGGTVRVLGLDPWHDRRQLQVRMSIQPQKAAIFPFQTITELMRTWATFYPAPDSVDAVIDRLGLSESRNIRIGKLSGGQQQRVLIGLALIGRPDLVVLDEPSTGLDPNARQELWAVLQEYRAEGGTVLISTHAMEEAEQLCGQVAILDHGSIVALGEPTDLIRRYSPGRTVAFTVPGLESLPGLADVGMVIDSRADGTGIRVRLVTRDSDEVLRLLAGIQARGIEIHDAGLDGVFRTLTGRAPDAAPAALEATK